MKDERCFDLFIQSFLKLSSPLGIKFVIYLNDTTYLQSLRYKLEHEYKLLPHTAMHDCLTYLNDNKVLIITINKAAIKCGRTDFCLCDSNIPEETINVIIRPQCNLCFDLNYIDLERLFQINYLKENS